MRWGRVGARKVRGVKKREIVLERRDEMEDRVVDRVVATAEGSEDEEVK